MCDCIKQQLNNISRILLDIQSNQTESQCALNEIAYAVSGLSGNLEFIYASLASVNPMAIAAEYPTQEEDKVVYSTTKVRFLDMLNPNIVVLFKGTFDVDLPVYFKDTINFEHTVTFGDEDTPAMADQLVNNYNYPALYVGNYIILNPTDETLQKFKDGELQ